MKFRSLRTPLVLFGLVAMAAVVSRAADPKKDNKTAPAEQPGVIKFTSAPAPVQKTFREETKNAKIELLGEGVNEDKSRFYRAIVPVGNSDYDMAVSEAGLLLERIMKPATSEITWAECPPVVQKAVQSEFKGAKPDSIEKITAGKRSDYVMSVPVQKMAYIMVFTEDGTLMSKVLDDSGEADVPSPEPVKKVSEGDNKNKSQNPKPKR